MNNKLKIRNEDLSEKALLDILGGSSSVGTSTGCFGFSNCCNDSCEVDHDISKPNPNQKTT